MYIELVQRDPKSVGESAQEKLNYSLILINDDVHTFEFVIDNLVAYCDHNPIQAEQCAWIVHHNGQCIIKVSSKKVVEKCAEQLKASGLHVEVSKDHE
ncbi:MAG: ATP-dependent Clp protease adaptor protein ClpS [Sphingobacteriales bacterium]|jgi:ATP-dependent Clp protease adaptor protein ClpS